MVAKKKTNGKRSKVTITKHDGAPPTPPAQSIPGPASVVLARSAIVDALRAVAMFASNDETRPQLNGVLVRNNGQHVTLVGTNGHFCGVMDLEGAAGGATGDFIVPLDTVKQLLGLLKNKDIDRVCLTQGYARLFIDVLPAAELSWKPVTARFPPFETVISAARGKGNGTIAIGAKLTQIVCRAFAAVGADFVHVSVAGEMDAVICSNETVPLLVVLMPGRCGPGVNRWTKKAA